MPTSGSEMYLGTTYPRPRSKSKRLWISSGGRSPICLSGHSLQSRHGLCRPGQLGLPAILEALAKRQGQGQGGGERDVEWNIWEVSNKFRVFIWFYSFGQIFPTHLVSNIRCISSRRFGNNGACLIKKKKIFLTNAATVRSAWRYYYRCNSF